MDDRPQRHQHLGVGVPCPCGDVPYPHYPDGVEGYELVVVPW